MRNPVWDAALSLNHPVSWALEGGPAPVELTDASVQRIVTSHEHLRTAGRTGAVYG
jgi:histidine ammonia-lyase